jgi:hypothetical protein
MIPEKLFKDSDVILQDVEELTDILNNHLNKACAYYYYVHGMTEITKTLIHAFYKLRIKILEMAVRHYEELKESDIYTLSNPEYVTRLATHQAEIDEAKEDYDYFLTYEEIRKD